MTDEYDPLSEHNAAFENFQEFDFNTPSALADSNFDFDAIVSNFASGDKSDDINLLNNEQIAPPDVNIDALMKDTIDNARVTIGLEADENQFYDTVSKMNTFARLSVLVDEIKKDPTEWFLYLYLKHTNYHSYEKNDDYAIHMSNNSHQTNSTPTKQMDFALNQLSKVYDRDPRDTSEPQQVKALSALRDVTSIRIDSTVTDVKKKKTVDYVQLTTSPHITADVVNDVASLSIQTGLNFVYHPFSAKDFFLKLDDRFIYGCSENNTYGLTLLSFDGSKHFDSSHMSTVYLRSAKLKNDTRNYFLDIKTIRPFVVKHDTYFGMEIFEHGGYRIFKNLLNKLKMPYFLKYRAHNKVHFVAIPAHSKAFLPNSVFFRNYYNSVRNQKIPFNAQNLVRYADSIPNSCLMNFQSGKNINGTYPCDGYCQKYYNAITNSFVTPAYFPSFRPSDGRCMNQLECNCFVANSRDINAFQNLYIAFEGDRQIPLGQRKICTFCSTSYFGDECTNNQHKTRVASRLKQIQTKFKNVEENLFDPCAECALILRRINSDTPGLITMEDANFVNYESVNPNAIMLSSLLYHYGGKTIVVDAETQNFIRPYLEEIACNVVVVDIQNRDEYKTHICSAPVCGRIREWKKLSCITDIVLSTQLKVQDSDERSNDPDALLSALGIVEEATYNVRKHSQEYLASLNSEVKKIAKRLNTDGVPGMQSKRTRQMDRRIRKKKN